MDLPEAMQSHAYRHYATSLHVFLTKYPTGLNNIKESKTNGKVACRQDFLQAGSQKCQTCLHIGRFNI